MIKLNPWTRGKLTKKLDFNFRNIVRMNIRSFPQIENQSRAIFRTENGFSVVIDELSNAEYFMVDIEYKIEEKNFSDFLVQKDVETEALDKDKNEYWMHAQLKHLSTLNTKYGRLDLQDVDLVVDVGVHKDIKDLIPSKLIKSLEITRDWIVEKDVEKKAKLSREHVYTQRRGLKKEDEMTSLNKLQDLFNPGIFGVSYIDVERPFRYSNCIRGTDFYDNIPFLTIPKNMQVITRADLNLDNPAVEGKMIYKKGNFQDRIRKLYEGK